jgi:hypothetical protein
MKLYVYLALFRNWQNVSYNAITRSFTTSFVLLATFLVRFIKFIAYLLRRQETNSVVLVRKRTISTERPPFVGEVVRARTVAMERAQLKRARWRHTTVKWCRQVFSVCLRRGCFLLWSVPSGYKRHGRSFESVELEAPAC